MVDDGGEAIVPIDLLVEAATGFHEPISTETFVCTIRFI
jgi:hypothetical protein